MFEAIHLRLDPFRLISMANERLNWRLRARIVKGQRLAVQIAWAQAGKPRVVPPADVLITRVAPCKLDTDNMVSAAKALRDAIAELAGVDDRHDDRVSYSYAQRKDPTPRTYAVEIDIVARGAQ